MPSNTTPSRPLRRTTARLSRPLRTDHDIDHNDSHDNDKENISSSSKPSPSPQLPPPTRRLTRKKARSTSMPEDNESEIRPSRSYKSKPCPHIDNDSDSESDSQYSSSKSSDITNNPQPKGKAKDDSANTKAPWRHPDELDYLRPHDWSEDKIISKLRSLVFTIPAPVTGKQPFIQITLYDHGDFEKPRIIKAPRGYRVPLMFVAKFQWASLKLVLTSAQRDKEWSDYKFDILHLSRLCECFFKEAEQACNKGILDISARAQETPSDFTTMSRKWRSPTFDRALARYNKNWLISREEFLRDFYREFENEEYEKDVLKIDWSRWALKGHKGFKLTQDELRAGIDGRMITRGLKKTDQGKWVWVDEFVIKQEEVAAVIIPPSQPVTVVEDHIPLVPTQNGDVDEPMQNGTDQSLDVAAMDITSDNLESTQVVDAHVEPTEPRSISIVASQSEVKESTPVSEETPRKSASPMVEDESAYDIPPIKIPARISRPLSNPPVAVPIATDISPDTQPPKSPSPVVESIPVEEPERTPTPSLPEVENEQVEQLDTDFDDIILYADEEDTKEHIVIRSFTPTSIDSTPTPSPTTLFSALPQESTQATTMTLPTSRSLSVTPTHISNSNSNTPPPHDSHQREESDSPIQSFDTDSGMSTPVAASPAKLPIKSPSPVPQEMEKALTINGDDRVVPTWAPGIFDPPRPPSPARSESSDEIPGLGGLSSRPMLIPSSPPPFFPPPEHEPTISPPSPLLPSPSPSPPPRSAPLPKPDVPKLNVPEWPRRSAVPGFRSGGFLGPFRSGGFITLDDELPTSSRRASPSPKPTSEALPSHKVENEEVVSIPVTQILNGIVEIQPEPQIIIEMREEVIQSTPEVEEVVLGTQTQAQVLVVEDIDDNDSDMDFGTPVTSPVIIVPCAKIEEIDPLPPPPSPPSALKQLSIQDHTWQSQNEDDTGIQIHTTQPGVDNQDQHQPQAERHTPGSPMRISDSNMNINGVDQSQGTSDVAVDSTPKATATAAPPFTLEPPQPLSIASKPSQQLPPIGGAYYVTGLPSTTQQYSMILPYTMSNSSNSAPVSSQPSRSPTPPLLRPVSNFHSEQPRPAAATVATNSVLPEMTTNMPPPQNTPSHFQTSFTAPQPQSPYHSTPRQEGSSTSTNAFPQNRTVINSREASVNMRSPSREGSHRSESQPRSLYTNHSSASVLSRKRQREEDTDDDDDDERMVGRNRNRSNKDDGGSGVVVRKVVSMVRDTLTGLNDLLELATERDFIPSDKSVIASTRIGRGKGKERALGMDVDVSSPYDHHSFSSTTTQPTSPSFPSFVRAPPIRSNSSMMSTLMTVADSSDILFLQEELRNMRMDLVQLQQERTRERESETPINNPEVRAMRQELEMMREQLRSLKEKNTRNVVEEENSEVRLMRDEMASLRNEMRLLQSANTLSRRPSMVSHPSGPSTPNVSVRFNMQPNSANQALHPLAHLITAESDSTPPPPTPSSASTSHEQGIEEEGSQRHHVPKKHYEESLIGDIPLPAKSKRKARAILSRS